MSQAESQPNGVQSTVTKKVDVVAYLADQDHSGWREWANEHDDERDYFERKETEHTRHYLKGFGKQVKIDEEVFDRFEGQNIGNLNLEKETETSSRYKRRPQSSIIRDIRDELAGELPDEVEDYKQDSYLKRKYVDEGGNTVIHINKGTDRLPMLKHPSEITPEDMYEGDEQLFAAKFKIRVKNVTPEELAIIDDKVVSEFIKLAGRHWAFDRVRVYECEQENKQEGVCFTI